MSEFFDEKELEKKIKMEPHDYSKDLERLDQKIRKTQFSYIDTVLNRLKKVRQRALVLIAAGVLLATASLLASDLFQAYDTNAYFFLQSLLISDYGPSLGFIGMLLPAIAVFAFLVWLYNRETRIYLYLAQKSSEAKKKTGFIAMLSEPFLILVLALFSGLLLLTAFSFLGCSQFACHFYDSLTYLSSNLLFNLLALSFYLVFLGGLQLKRYIGLVKLGVKDFYKDMGL